MKPSSRPAAPPRPSHVDPSVSPEHPTAGTGAVDTRGCVPAASALPTAPPRPRNNTGSAGAPPARFEVRGERDGSLLRTGDYASCAAYFDAHDDPRHPLILRPVVSGDEPCPYLAAEEAYAALCADPTATLDDITAASDATRERCRAWAEADEDERLACYCNGDGPCLCGTEPSAAALAASRHYEILSRRAN